MNSKDLLVQSIEKNEFIKFLCGANEYKIEPSQYVPGSTPTDTGSILSDAIYEFYKDNVKIKENFENALINMISGTSLELYIAAQYIMDVLFNESHNLATFQIDKDEILPKLKSALNKRKIELINEIRFPDGLFKKNAWDDIARWNQVCKMKYGITICEV